MRILFSDERNFGIDKVDNLQNDRVWAPSHSEANERGGIVEKRKFPQKVIIWLGACSIGISPSEDTLDRVRYIKEVLLVAFKYGNQVFAFQRDGATVHIPQLIKQ